MLKRSILLERTADCIAYVESASWTVFCSPVGPEVLLIGSGHSAEPNGFASLGPERVFVVHDDTNSQLTKWACFTDAVKDCVQIASRGSFGTWCQLIYPFTHKFNSYISNATAHVVSDSVDSAPELNTIDRIPVGIFHAKQLRESVWRLVARCFIARSARVFGEMQSHPQLIPLLPHSFLLISMSF